LNSRNTPTSQLRKLIAPGPLLLLAFFVEGVLGKGNLPGIRIGFALHMVLTGLGLAVLVVAGEVLSLRCPEQAWRETDRRTANIRCFAGCLAAWGLVSCVFQDSFVVGNLCFWAMWATTYLVAFRSVPRLLSGLPPETRVSLLSVTLGIGVVGSLLMPEYRAERFGGVFGGPTWTGLFTAAAVAHWTAYAVFAKRILRPWLFVLGGASAILLATRTRASIAAGVLGSMACLTYASLRRQAAGKTRAWHLLALSVCGLLALGALFASAEPSVKTRVLEHFRLERGPSQVYLTARAMNWEQGASSFFENGPVGRGFLSKFGNPKSTQTVLGIEVPRYDWTTDQDPLNSLFLINQQIGLPGAVLFLLLLGSLWRSGRRTHEHLRVYFVGFFVIGLVTAFLNGNWLLSFGDLFDRYSYIALAALLYCPEAPRKTGRYLGTTSRLHGSRA